MRSIHAWVLTAALAAAHLPAHAGGGGLVLPRLTPVPEPVLATGMATALPVAAAEGDTAIGQSWPAVATPASARSPRRAFLYSALVPGSGELWAGAGRRAVLFFGLEVAGLGTYITWNGKGKDLEDDFRARADQEYNPWNYLGWRASRNSRFSSITHALPCSSYVAAAPSSTPVADAIADCPGSEKQQFYELIGKYNQFVAGWKDLVGPDGNPAVATEVDSAENFSSDLRLSYEEDRDESNKYLKRASNALGFLLVNHVLSAIDAARVARARGLGQGEALIDRRTRFGVAFGGRGGSTPMLLAWRPLE